MAVDQHARQKRRNRPPSIAKITNPIIQVNLSCTTKHCCIKNTIGLLGSMTFPTLNNQLPKKIKQTIETDCSTCIRKASRVCISVNLDVTAQRCLTSQA
ncbi:hypothetical protein OAA48_00520, partial [bacterium]|nr:hypothetical protein [bacterium]